MNNYGSLIGLLCRSELPVGFLANQPPTTLSQREPASRLSHIVFGGSIMRPSVDPGGKVRQNVASGKWADRIGHQHNKRTRTKVDRDCGLEAGVSGLGWQVKAVEETRASECDMPQYLFLTPHCMFHPSSHLALMFLAETPGMPGATPSSSIACHSGESGPPGQEHWWYMDKTKSLGLRSITKVLGTARTRTATGHVFFFFPSREDDKTGTHWP